MFKLIALSIALLWAPAVSWPAEASLLPPKEAAKKDPKDSKTPAPAAQTKKREKAGPSSASHEHAEEAWVCNTFYDSPTNPHVCTYKSGKPGKCAWCGAKLVKAGSKADLERQTKAPKGK